MNFYSEWEHCKNTDKKDLFITSFLNSTPQSLCVLLNGNKSELVTACNVLLNTSIPSMLSQLNTDSIYSSEDIIQFSNFEHAIIDICACCEFESDGLSFSELGKRIKHSKQDSACKKYGENHAKLASELSFVTLFKDDSYKVKNTALGSFSLSLDDKDRYELIRRLSLRNCFIKSLLYNAKIDTVNYFELAAKVLSRSTCIRRKGNVKYLLSLILSDDVLNNYIVWE